MLISAVHQDYVVGSEPGELGEELASCEGEDGFGIGDLFGDLSSGVEWVGGGYDGAEGHDGEADDWEGDGVGG